MVFDLLFLGSLPSLRWRVNWCPIEWMKTKTPSAGEFSHCNSSKMGYQSLVMEITKNTRARFLSLAQSKLRLCLANHRAGYFSNLACDWLSIVWAYSEHETENGPRSTLIRHGSDTFVSNWCPNNIHLRKYLNTWKWLPGSHVVFITITVEIWFEICLANNMTLKYSSYKSQHRHT